MLDLTNLSDSFVPWLWRASWQGAALATLVLVVQKLLGDRLAPRMRYGLWMIVMIRLVAPTLPASPTSVFNLEKLTAAAPVSPVVLDNPSLLIREMRDPEVGPPAAQAKESTLQVEVLVEPIATAPTAQTAASTPLKSGWNWTVWLFGIWAAGVAVLSCRLGQNGLRLHQELTRLEPIADAELLATLHACREQIGTRKTVRVLWADELESPALAGVVRPCLLVPRRLALELSPDDLRMVFLHELTHLKRADLLTNWLLTGVGLLHWFNPMVWFAAARCRSDRELACDATVLNSLPPSQRRGYGLAILNIVAQLSEHGARPAVLCPAVVGIVERPSHVHRRIAMIASFERYTGPWSMLGGLLVMLSVAIMTLTNATDPTHQAQAASSEPPAAPPLDARLAGPASDYEYSDTPLEDALDHLAQSTNLNFAIDWKALADLGLNRDTPVTLSLKNARPVQALDWILRLVGTPSDSRLDWWMDEDLVTVSTHDRSLRQQAKIVRYSLKDLVPEGVDEDAVVQNLVTIIPSFIGRSNDWEANGGVSSVQPLGDAVIVKTTPENHRQLALLLAALAKPDGEPRLLESVDAATLKGLEKRTTFEFNDTPLADVLSYCQEASGVNLVINWKALEDLGINRETPVSLTLKNRSALDALHKVAAIVSSDEGNPMVVQLVDNVLYVTSASELGAGIRAIAAYRLPSKVVRKEDGTAQFVGMTLSTVGTPHEWLNNGGRVAHVDVFAKRYAVLLAPSRHHEELRAILKQE